MKEVLLNFGAKKQKRLVDYKKIIPNMGLMRDDCVGSLILSFTVDFPQTLTPEQIKILREVL